MNEHVAHVILIAIPITMFGVMLHTVMSIQPPEEITIHGHNLNTYCGGHQWRSDCQHPPTPHTASTRATESSCDALDSGICLKTTTGI